MSASSKRGVLDILRKSKAHSSVPAMNTTNRNALAGFEEHILQTDELKKHPKLRTKVKAMTWYTNSGRASIVYGATCMRLCIPH